MVDVPPCKLAAGQYRQPFFRIAHVSAQHDHKRKEEFFLWEEHHYALLRQWWREGVTTSEMGVRLGVTKNAICGKIRRLDLPKRHGPTETHPLKADLIRTLHAAGRTQYEISVATGHGRERIRQFCKANGLAAISPRTMTPRRLESLKKAVTAAAIVFRARNPKLAKKPIKDPVVRTDHQKAKANPASKPKNQVKKQPLVVFTPIPVRFNPLQCTWLDGSTRPYVRCENIAGKHPSWCEHHRAIVFTYRPVMGKHYVE